MFQRVSSLRLTSSSTFSSSTSSLSRFNNYHRQPFHTATIKYSAPASASSTHRSYRILGIQQIALGSTNKSNLSKLWVDIFGLTKTHSFQSTKENVDEDICVLGNGAHAVEVDLMQPLDETKSPKVHIPPLNHIGLWVDDLPACVKELTSKGMRFTPGGIRKGASGFDVCFIHPKGNDEFPLCGEGVLIELVQAPKNVIEANKK